MISDYCEGLNHRKIDGSCYYIETERLSLENATINCGNAFGPGVDGILFEPKDKNTHDLVVAAALGMESTNYWLGISDKQTEGEFHYNTGSKISFSNWDTGKFL